MLQIITIVATNRFAALPDSSEPLLRTSSLSARLASAGRLSTPPCRGCDRSFGRRDRFSFHSSSGRWCSGYLSAAVRSGFAVTVASVSANPGRLDAESPYSCPFDRPLAHQLLEVSGLIALSWGPNYGNRLTPALYPQLDFRRNSPRDRPNPLFTFPFLPQPPADAPARWYHPCTEPHIPTHQRHRRPAALQPRTSHKSCLAPTVEPVGYGSTRAIPSQKDLPRARTHIT